MECADSSDNEISGHAPLVGGQASDARSDELRPVVFTVGHGTRTSEELGDVLASAGVSLLVDVRRFPGSRRHPHFARESLEGSLQDLGIDYRWMGEELGGRRGSAKGAPSRHPAWTNAAFRAYADHMDTEDFRAALSSLEDDARRQQLAIMCAETLWWRCHRRLIADSLTVDGFRVVHLLGPAKQQPHVLHEAVRTDDLGRPVYDVGTDRELPLS